MASCAAPLDNGPVTQTLPKAEGMGTGLGGDREGPALLSLGARHSDTACAVLSPECATTSRGSGAPQVSALHPHPRLQSQPPLFF